MTDKRLGFFALAVSLLILFAWIPLDVESGFIEKARRSLVLGDAFAPTIATVLIAIGACLIFIERRGKPAHSTQDTESVSASHDGVQYLQCDNLKYLLATLSIITVALAVMRYGGPLLVVLIGEEDASYRLLRDTPPWKYIGFVAGGVLLISGLIAWVERRFRFRFLVIGIIAVLVLIAVYDLPFDDLLLPPNGDV